MVICRFGLILPIPVTLGVFIERGEHNWKYYFHIIADEVTEILVVPEIKRPLSDLRHVKNDMGMVSIRCLPGNEDWQPTWPID